MADFASQILGIASQTAQNQPDLVGAVSKGADLAQHISNIQTQREQIEQKKQEIEMQRIEKVGSLFETAGKMPEGKARNAFMKNYIPNAIKALGMGDKIDLTVQEMMMAEPTVVPYLKASLTDGSLTMPQLYEAMQDPEKMALLMTQTNLDKFGGQEALRSAMSEYPEALGKAYEKGTLEGNKMDRAHVVQQGQNYRQGNQISEAGNIEYSKKMGSVAAKLNGEGGAAGATKTIGNLKKSLDELNNGKVQLGGVWQALTAGQPMIRQ
jgi:hypothetical protein